MKKAQLVHAFRLRSLIFSKPFAYGFAQLGWQDGTKAVVSQFDVEA
jgi:hypothetical protein